MKYMKKLIKKFCSLNTAAKHNIISVVLALCLATVLMNVKSNHFGAVLVSNTNSPAYNLPIVMYHSVLNDKTRVSKYVITPEILKEDIKYYKEKGYTAINVADLVAFTENGTPLPPKPILLTFDDGYFNNYSYVFPVLKETKQKAVLSVVGIYADTFSREGEKLNNNYSHATWKQIYEMDKSSLVEIQNHSYDMHDLTRRKGSLRNKGEDKYLYRENLINDTLRTSTLIKEVTGKSPLAYTYPFGAVSQDSREIIESLGFKATFGCEEGINVITRNSKSLYDLKRYNRDGRGTTKEFFDKILIN